MRRFSVQSRTLQIVAVVAAWLVALPTSAAEAPSAEALELFERDVRPVLVETCQKCHGPDKQENDLRLDSPEAAVRGGASGAVIVPGKPNESLLIEAIRQIGDLKMPPKDKLSGEKIAAISRWIELGAPWPAAGAAASKARDAARTHWAFQPIRDPAVPTVGNDGAPVENPIDAFVRAKLQTVGLAPSPRADRRTLIRRATFDLTGLPPSAEEVDAFVRDDEPNAYERLVDRLLASPHYGEQWARHWLDVARYADTKGYVYARENRTWVHAWAYRDWVVQALNDDMPYDRFLLLQMAADQAAPDDRASLAAMGFLTLGRRFLGVTHDIIDDRIDVVTRGTMGLTVACARCHDHKFDPIPTRDYYSLYGVFQNCAERQVPIAQTATHDEAYQAFEKELQARQQKLDATLAQHRAEWGARVRARVAEYLLAQLELSKYPEEGFDQILEKDDILPAFVRRWQAYLDQAKQRNDPVLLAWSAFSEIKPEEFSRRSAEVTTALTSGSLGLVHPLVLARFSSPPASIQDVAQRYGQLFAEIDQQWQTVLKDAAEKHVPAPTALANADAEALRLVLYGDSAPCEVPNESMVNIETFFDLAACEELWKLQAEVDKLLIESPAAPAYAVILRDRNPPRPARVFKRGRPSNKGEEAPPQFLELLSGENRQPFKNGSGRLELARAIVDPQNPLTARVIVNRIWLHHFGAGLVRTPSDFGTRCEPPTHPELLDWLATRFIEDGWSIKKLHRRIMLSETYCQSSAGLADPEKEKQAVQLDPENRLLWRMTERRLTFEELHDALLAAAGQLDLHTGGKPADMFNSSFKRRALYGLVDRQFLPSTLRVFDFANPDLHIPLRSDTTVPQQALFFLNNELVLNAAKATAGRLSQDQQMENGVKQLYRIIYQREPTENQIVTALEFIDSADSAAELNPWEQLAQVLLSANEFVFVD